MRSSTGRTRTVILASLILMALATDSVSTPPQRALPNPVLVFISPEFYEANGKQWTRYKYYVDNADAYPNELFAAAPDLPPCGQNANSARAWVDVFDSTGKRLYGFCALGNRDGLGQLWFALETDVVPPSWVYIEINDRKTGIKYKSNLAETTG